MLQLKNIIVLLILVFTFQLSSAQVNILNAKVASDIGVKTAAQIEADNDKPLPYGYVDDRDILWSVEVWEVIDLNERANFPLLFPTDTLEVDAYRRSLYDVLIKNIKNGKDVVLNSGEVIANEVLTFAPQRPQSYAYCSDTLYFEGLAADIQGARVVYHESTFLKNNEELAAKTMHATAYQAGLTAKNAGAEALILGHYSSRYADVNLFKAEAQEVFPNVYLAEDGKKFVFN